MARDIVIGKQGGPLDNAIHAASVRLEELKFGDLAGAQSGVEMADDTDGRDYIATVVAEANRLRPVAFDADDVIEAFNRYGYNNAVHYARSGIGPLLGVKSSWLDGFLHGVGAACGLAPEHSEMRGRMERGYE